MWSTADDTMICRFTADAKDKPHPGPYSWCDVWGAWLSTYKLLMTVYWHSWVTSVWLLEGQGICTSYTFVLQQICWSQVYIHAYILHSESKKLCHSAFVHNFDKCWPIFTILSLLHSPRNLQQNTGHVAVSSFRGTLCPWFLAVNLHF